VNIQTVNIDGNLLKVIRAKSTKMKGIDNNKPYDFDLYEIEARSPLATRELSLIVVLLIKKYRRYCSFWKLVRFRPVNRNRPTKTIDRSQSAFKTDRIHGTKKARGANPLAFIVLVYRFLYIHYTVLGIS
jgi:hypothetical protein